MCSNGTVIAAKEPDGRQAFCYLWAYTTTTKSSDFNSSRSSSLGQCVKMIVKRWSYVPWPVRNKRRGVKLLVLYLLYLRNRRPNEGLVRLGR